MPKPKRFTIIFVTKDTAWIFVEQAIGFHGASLINDFKVSLGDPSPFELPSRVVSIGICIPAVIGLLTPDTRLDLPALDPFKT